MPKYAEAPLAQAAERGRPFRPKMRIGCMNCVVLKPVADMMTSKSWCVPSRRAMPVDEALAIARVSRATLERARAG